MDARPSSLGQLDADRRVVADRNELLGHQTKPVQLDERGQRTVGPHPAARLDRLVHRVKVGREHAAVLVRRLNHSVRGTVALKVQVLLVDFQVLLRAGGSGTRGVHARRQRRCIVVPSGAVAPTVGCGGGGDC